MTTVRDLGLPPGWAAPNWFRLLGTFGTAALMVALSLIMIAVGADALGDRTLFGVAMMLFGVGIGDLSVLSVWNVMRVRRTAVRGVDLAKDDDGTPVLRVRQPRARQVATTAWLLAVGAGALLLGVSALTAGAITGLLYLVGGLVALPLALLLVTAPLSEIRLGPETVRVRDGRRSLTATWDDVELVVASETRFRRQIFLRALNVQRAERSSWNATGRRRHDAHGIEIPTEQFAVSPVPLFHLLRFYHEQPLARTELGTAASLQRIREARFTAP